MNKDHGDTFTSIKVMQLGIVHLDHLQGSLGSGVPNQEHKTQPQADHRYLHGSLRRVV
jgi:hypothetical protein